MDTISPAFQLKHESELRPIKGRRALQAWRVNDDTGTVFYVPRRIMFAMGYDTPAEDNYVRLLQLTARVVHVCDDNPLPPSFRLRKLALEAIHIFALFAEVCRLPDRAGDSASASDDPDDDGIPF